jgi:hypothetical protein
MMADGEISAAAAASVLRVKAVTLEECAAAVVLDRPDLYRKWVTEARKIRDVLGEPAEVYAED